MVCPNCHSTDIIAVQDQHFCISCGQMVPEAVVKAAQTKTAAKSGAKVAVGVGASSQSAAEVLPKPSEKTGYATIIPQRHRISDPAGDDQESAADDKSKSESPAADADSAADTSPKPKLRKPGRPKARLDVPADLPAAPKLSPTLPPAGAAKSEEPAPVPEPPKSEAPAKSEPPAHPKPAAHHAHAAKKPRHLSDIRPPKSAKSEAPKPPAAHQVGVAPLHFGAVLAFSLRSRAQPHWFALGAAGTVVLAAATAYAAWLYLTGGLAPTANRIAAGAPTLVAELTVLALLYYIGRSLSQTAIIYGLAREADHRPVTLGRQFGVSVNTFGRRLGLDAGYLVLELVLFYFMGSLLFIGGSPWPVGAEWQIVALFSAFLIMLYLLTALGLAKGLAGVALTLGSRNAHDAAKSGWRLFNHHFELVFLRFLALAIELVLMLPVAAVAAALLVAAPASLHLLVAFGVGVLALIAGGLLGAGTAAWWVALYRRLLEIQPGAHADAPLMSAHQAVDARPGPLTVVVSLTTLLIAAALALPWLNF